MEIICKSCGHTNISDAILCVNCGSELKAEESNFFRWLMWLYPFVLLLVGYISAIPTLGNNVAERLGGITTAVFIYVFIPLVVILIRKIFKRKKLTIRGKVFLFYGISLLLFFFYLLGKVGSNVPAPR